MFIVKNTLKVALQYLFNVIILNTILFQMFFYLQLHFN